MNAREMTDLLDRLRTWYQPSHKTYPTHPVNPDGEEAAAEIERLRAIEAAARKVVPILTGLRYTAGLGKTQMERMEALQLALDGKASNG